MKRLFLALLGCGLLLPATAAHAALADLLVNNNMQDLSFSYLQDIFGVVDGVLHGSGTQIMGQLFGAFNAAVLTLGFIIMSYVFFVSTINTAHEGEIMGKKWSSVWIPLRIVASVALIVPKASGYCAIQIFVMGTVVSGVVAANKVMNAGLGYLQNGGVLIQSSPPPDPGKVKAAGTILKSLTCMNGVYNIVMNDAVSNGQAIPAKFVPTQYVSGNPTIINFPQNGTEYAYNNTHYDGICGNVTWSAQNTTTSEINPDNPTLMIDTQHDLRGIAVQQMVLDLQPFAQSLANVLVPPKTTVSSSSSETVQDVLNANNLALVFAAADYKGIMMPYYAHEKGWFANQSLKTIADTAKQGWIKLGSLYYNIASINGNYGASVDGNNDVVNASSTMKTDVDGYAFVSKSAGFNNIDFTNPKPASPLDAYISNSSIADKINGFGGYQAGAQNSVAADGAFSDNPAIQLIINAVAGPLYGVIYNMQALFDAKNQNTDPIIAVSGLGSSLVNLVSLIWFSVSVGIIGITAALGGVPFVTLSNSILSFLIWFVPLFAALLLTMFVSGAVMAFYVPLIPFIIFTFAALGWLTTVLEAMIAAPLVALGIAYPEQHEIFGKAEPAIMLLANVFLRPTLMVFGFFGGAILSHVGLWLLNSGFNVAWGQSLGGNFGHLGIFGIIWALVASIVIYMALVLAIINQTFGLIHQLPDELMRWLGGGMRALGGSPSEALSGVQSQVKGDMQAAGKGLSGNAATKAKATQEERAKAKKPDEIEGGNGGGNPGAGGGTNPQ